MPSRAAAPAVTAPGSEAEEQPVGTSLLGLMRTLIAHGSKK
jgi:hypothetical protein